MKRGAYSTVEIQGHPYDRNMSYIIQKNSIRFVSMSRIIPHWYPFTIDIIAKRIRLVEHSMGWAKMTTVVFDTELWGQICKIESFKCKRSDSGSQKCLINTRMDSPECWSYDHSMSWSFYRLNKHLENKLKRDSRKS